MREYFALCSSLILLCSACESKMEVDVQSKPGSRDPRIAEELEIKSPANLVTNQIYTLEWTSLGEGYTYQVIVSRHTACQGESLLEANLSTAALVLDFLHDGQYYLCVFGKRDPDVFAAANNGVSLVIDRQKPTVTFRDAIKSFNVAFKPGIDLDDLSHVNSAWTVVSGPGVVKLSAPTDINPTISANIDGLYQLEANFTDAAGNRQSVPFQFNWDTSGPRVDLGASRSSLSPLTINPIVDHSAVRYEWSYSDGPVEGLVTFSDKNAVNPLISADRRGSYRLTLKAFDEIGNRGEDTIQFTWDPAPLVVNQIHLHAHLHDGILNGPEQILANPLLAALDASAYTAVSYRVVTNSRSCDASLNFQTIAPLASDPILNQDGTYKVCLRLSNDAGDLTFASSPSFIRDATPAYFVSAALTLAASDGWINSSERTQSQNLISLPVATKPSSFTYALVQEATPCTASLSYGTSIPRSDDPLLASDGFYRVCVRIADNVGNGLEYGMSDRIALDQVAPVLNTFILNQEASDGFIIDGEKLANHALWTFTAQAPYTANYSDPLSEEAAVVSCGTGQSYPRSTIPTAANLSVDDLYVICLKLSDPAGNLSFAKSPQVRRDTQAPVFSSLLGASEASDGYIQPSEVNSTAALFALTASSYTSVLYTLALDDATPVTCGGSQTYAQTSVPAINALTADGSFALCVKLSDAAGNITYGKSQTIVRDTVTPVFSSLSKAAEAIDGSINESERNQTNPLWSLSASGYASLAFTTALTDTAGSLTCDGTQTYNQGATIASATGLGADGAWSICVKLSDLAGNISWGKAEQIVRDTVVPSFTSLALANAASDGYVIDSEKLLVSALWTLTGAGYSSAAYTLAQDDAGGGLTCNGSQTYGQASIATPASLASDGTYAICVRLLDLAGNITYGKSAQLIRDIVAPTLTTFTLANEASDQLIVVGEENSSLALLAFSGSNYDAAAFTPALSNSPSSVTCDSSQTYSQSAAPLINTVSSDGTYAACIRLTDYAGNSTYGKSPSLVRDATPPLISSFDGANAAADGYINSAELNSALALWALSASAYTTASYSSVQDETGGSVTCNSAKTYDQSSIPLINSLSSDGSYILCVKLVDSVGNITYGKSQQIIRDIVSPDAPSSLTASAAYRSLDLRWVAGGGSPAAYVLVRGAAGSAPTFTPTTGASYTSGTASGADTLVYVGNGMSRLDSSLTLNTAYFYRLYAYDAAKNFSSSAATVSGTPVSPCAANWIYVPGDSAYATGDFCIMKYEGKDDGSSNVISQAASSPYTALDFQSSQTICSALGIGYHLVNDLEYMTLAAQVFLNVANWSGASLGSGVVANGHTDGSPGLSCPASANDLQSYVEGADCTFKASGGGEDDEIHQRRTNILPNGQVVWDLAGNSWEWVDYRLHYNNRPTTPDGNWNDYSATTAGASSPLTYLVPNSSVKSSWVNTWNSSQGVGKYFNDGNTAHDSMRRSGGYGAGIVNTGLFQSQFYPPNSAANASPRCVLSIFDQDISALRLTPGSASIAASWSSTGATGYLLVRGAANAAPSFSPSNGTTYSVGSQGSDQIVYRGTDTSITESSLTDSSVYTYALYSYDATSNYSVLARAQETPISCPSNSIRVSADRDFGTQDFCIMQYEARNGGSNVPSSSASSTPWTSISMVDARTYCTAIGLGYDIPSNEEWMTIASEIASQGSNWSSGTVGTGHLFRGHSDNNPTSLCQASSNASLAYVESTCTPIAAGAGEDEDTTQRRVHYLANSSVIWDLSGNAWEWINPFNMSSKPGATAAWYEYTSLSGTTSMPLKYLVPTHSVKSYWSDTWNSGYSVGQFYPGANSSGGALVRGGRYDGTTSAGLFAGALSSASSSTDAYYGFRCVARK